MTNKTREHSQGITFNLSERKLHSLIHFLPRIHCSQALLCSSARIPTPDLTHLAHRGLHCPLTVMGTLVQEHPAPPSCSKVLPSEMSTHGLDSMHSCGQRLQPPQPLQQLLSLPQWVRWMLERLGHLPSNFPSC